MKKVVFVSLMLMLLSAVGCLAKSVKGNGKIVTKEITLGEFHSLQLAKGGFINPFNLVSFIKKSKQDSYTCHYSQTDDCSLTLTIDENLMEYIQITLQDSVLSVQVEKGQAISPTQFQLHVTSKELKQLTVSSAMDLCLDTPLHADRLKLTANSGSDLLMKQPVQANHLHCIANGGSDIYLTALTCGTLQGVANGGADLHLTGSADEAHLEANGGSDIKAYGLSTKQTICTANGGSDIFIYASETLRATANGGSDIHHKGPATVSASANGGSDVIRAD